MFVLRFDVKLSGSNVCSCGVFDQFDCLRDGVQPKVVAYNKNFSD